MGGIQLIFFDHFYFKIIEIDLFHEIILAETRFAVAFEIVDRGVQPERFSQIELDADFIQRAENLVGPCISRGIADDGVLQQAIILE